MANPIHLSLGIALLSLCAWANAEDPVDFLELDIETLMSIKVGPSADASAKGLSAPYTGGQVATGGRMGILGNREIMETPFSVTHYTQEFIQNHQATSIGDVIQYDPSVRIARGFGNFQQVYMIRGLPIFSDDMTYNGLYGILPRQYLAAELIERVTVLHGPNAFLNGGAPAVSGSLGGAVDTLPKRAPKEKLALISIGTVSDNQYSLTTDLATRSPDGSLGIRFNGVTNHGNTAVDGESNELDMATLGADYRGKALRISADLGYQDHCLDAARPSITIADDLAIPKAPGGQNIAQPWTFSKEHDLFGTLRAEYDINANMTGWAALGSRDSKETSTLSAFSTVINSDGDFSSSRFDVTHEDAVITGEIGLRAQGHLGTIPHTLTLSASAYQNQGRNAYVIYDSFSNNLYDPITVTAPTTPLFGGGDLEHPRITNTTQTASLAFADELQLLDNHLLVTLGARQQQFQEDNFDYNTGANLSSYDENRVTPVAALLYKLSPRYSLYTHYAEGLLKGDTVPETNNGTPVTNAGETLKPYQTKQTELGLKYDGGSVGASIATYEIRKPITGFSDQNTFEIIDHQVHRGLEILVFGKPLTNLKIMGGANFLNTSINNKRAIGVPGIQTDLDFEWEFSQVPGLTANSHLMHIGEQYTNQANTRKIPGWTRFDLGIRYEKHLSHFNAFTFRTYIENLTDENYWSSVGGFPNSNYLTLGNPRSLQLMATLTF